jgi:DNA mismatch repair ATPase MutS
MAGMPRLIIDRANELLLELEEQRSTGQQSPPSAQKERS